MLKVDDLHYLNFGFAHYIGKRRLAWMRQESRHFVQKCNFPWHQIHKYLPYNRKNYMPTHSVWKSQKKWQFSIASEASYVYILSGQKFIKNAKNGQFGEFLKIWSLWLNSVTRQLNFNETKISGKCQKWKTEMRHFGWFSNTVQLNNFMQRK